MVLLHLQEHAPGRDVVRRLDAAEERRRLRVERVRALGVAVVAQRSTSAAAARLRAFARAASASFTIVFTRIDASDDIARHAPRRATSAAESANEEAPGRTVGIHDAGRAKT